VRFCPFCSAENADELAVCQSCGRRLPPLPPRRRPRNAPGTGVQLPPRNPRIEQSARRCRARRGRRGPPPGAAAGPAPVRPSQARRSPGDLGRLRARAAPKPVRPCRAPGGGTGAGGCRRQPPCRRRPRCKTPPRRCRHRRRATRVAPRALAKRAVARTPPPSAVRRRLPSRPIPGFYRAPAVRSAGVRSSGRLPRPRPGRDVERVAERARESPSPETRRRRRRRNLSPPPPSPGCPGPVRAASPPHRRL